MDKNLLADEIFLDDEMELGQRDDTKFNCSDDHGDTKLPIEASDNEDQSSSQLGEPTTFEPGSFADNQQTITRSDSQANSYRSNSAETFSEATSSISQNPGPSGYANRVQQKKLAFLTNLELEPKEQGYFCCNKPRRTYPKKSEPKTVKLPQIGNNTFNFIVGLLLMKAQRLQTRPKGYSGLPSNNKNKECTQ